MKANRNATRTLQTCLKPVAADIRRAFATGGLGAILLSAQVAAMAAPSGAQVVGGQASVAQNKDATVVSQSSARAVVNWNSFNVGRNESVTFQQPSASSAILNRVVGADASTILGRISANGQVYLVNPNGIFFGRSAQVNAGSLMASTANISTSDFMAGRMNFNQPGKPNASIVNEGSITVADGGFVGLVAPSLRNSGVINARLGKATLAGGDAFTLDLHGDNLINLVVDQRSMQSLMDASGVPLSAYVDHSGAIVAEGGTVTLSVSTAKRLVDNIVNVDGVIRATSYDVKAGTIALHGDENSKVIVRGELDASGARSGAVSVTGGDITLGSTARISAGGGDTGGTVLVGGNWQGKGPLSNAQSVGISRGAVIDATGKAGGEVVVWSDKSTRFGGTIRNDNGKVEVSGKQQLAFDGEVKAAKLLLDPTNLFVELDGYAYSALNTLAGDSAIAASTINRQLALGTAVLLQATNNLTINRAIDGRGGTEGGTLTLDANNVNFGANVHLSNAKLTVTARGSVTQAQSALIYTGTGGVDIKATGGIEMNQVLAGGDVSLNSASGAVSVTTPLVAFTGGSVGAMNSLTIEGSSGVTLNGALVGPSGIAVSSQAGDIITASASPLQSSGNISLTAGRNVTIGVGGIKANGPRNIAIKSEASVAANGPLGTEGGNISVDSSGDILVNQLVTHLAIDTQNGSALLVSRKGDVTLARALGGEATGYVEFDKGYQTLLRPGVGRLTVRAPNGSIETNGLNLDGNYGALDPVKGLEISAGKRLIVNDTIAVNKGAISLDSTGAGDSDGIYLGSNVYSRGFDSYSGPNRTGLTTNDKKVAYQINVNANKNIVLFDNSSEQADFYEILTKTDALLSVKNDDLKNPAPPRDELPLPSYVSSIAKIIVSNNVANYSDITNASTLIKPVSSSPVITLSGTLQGANTPAGTPLRIKDPSPALTDLAATPNKTVTPSDSTNDGKGIGLKVLAFTATGDQSTKVNYYPCTGSSSCEFRKDGHYYAFQNLLSQFSGSNAGFDANDPKTSINGKASAADLSQLQFSTGSIAPKLETDVSALNEDRFLQDGIPIQGNRLNQKPPYIITNSYVETDPSGTRLFIYSGQIKKSEGEARSDRVGATKDVNLAAGANNSTTGFSSIGRFNIVGGPNTNVLALDPNRYDGDVNPGVNRPPVNTDRFPLGLEREGQLDQNAITVDMEEVAGMRPSSDADLGRGSSLSGKARNVFTVRYRLARTTDNSICAPADIEPAADQTGASGDNARVCK